MFAAFQIVPFYYYYFEIRNQMAALIHSAGTLTDGEIRHRLSGAIERLGLPVKAEDLRIERNQQRISLTFRYHEVLFIGIWGRDVALMQIPFEAQVSGPL